MDLVPVHAFCRLKLISTQDSWKLLDSWSSQTQNLFLWIEELGPRCLPISLGSPWQVMAIFTNIASTSELEIWFPKHPLVKIGVVSDEGPIKISEHTLHRHSLALLSSIIWQPATMWLVLRLKDMILIPQVEDIKSREGVIQHESSNTMRTWTWYQWCFSSDFQRAFAREFIKFHLEWPSLAEGMTCGHYSLQWVSLEMIMRTYTLNLNLEVFCKIVSSIHLTNYFLFKALVIFAHE